MSPFGAPSSWPDADLVAVSRQFDADLTLAAYRGGLFPMPIRGGLTGWYSPVDRGILPLDGLRVTRSLRKMLPRYEIRIDSDFDAVLDGCADRQRPGRWINAGIRRTYGELFAAGRVHCVEAWTLDGRLAGGLYGVGIGGFFAGESMFHRPDIGRDASKVALVALVELLTGPGRPEHRLLDVQWRTDHLASLGVVEVDRSEYLERLEVALDLSEPAWPRR